MDFPDLPNLKKLQLDLWSWPRSRSALMVGAGMSLNAEPLPGCASSFPTWRELVRAMFNELHPLSPEDTVEVRRAREVRFSETNALRIASEYEAAFGRQKLDRLILERNPDAEKQYQKSTAHCCQNATSENRPNSGANEGKSFRLFDFNCKKMLNGSSHFTRNGMAAPHGFEP